jgi:F0F1-type ATP synthase beta subunit
MTPFCHPGIVSPEQVAIAIKVAETLKSAASANQPDHKTSLRAERLERFLTTPFFVTESSSHLKPQNVAITDTIRGCVQILNGDDDNVPAENFTMIGPIEDADIIGR